MQKKYTPKWVHVELFFEDYKQKHNIDLNDKLRVFLNKVEKESTANEDIAILTVCKALEVPIEATKSKSRLKELVEARMMLYFYFIEEGVKLKTIGAKFSNRDHSTVINGINDFKDLLFKDKGIQRKAKVVKAALAESGLKFDYEKLL